MGKPFFESKICESRKRCWQCRVNVSYREGIAAVYDVPDVNFECPFGVTEASIPEDQQGATIADMAKGVTEAIVDSAVRLAKGQPILASKSEADKRMDICKACEYFRPGNKTCSVCECHMDIKTQLGGGYCPLKKH